MYNINPITKLDYPDPDVIRVDDTYYMVSTTMYFMPGCEILRSYDLINWEHAAFVYNRLDSTPAQKLSGKENIYGQGMWAASLRYHDGIFYIVFVANDTHKTYLYTASDINGPWKKSEIPGFYHDNSVLFMHKRSGERNGYQCRDHASRKRAQLYAKRSKPGQYRDACAKARSGRCSKQIR